MASGFSVALVRAVTAIPGHACFGVFMGVFNAFARTYFNSGKIGLGKFFRVLAVIIPAQIHGAYDFIASMESEDSTWILFVFIAVLFVISFIMIMKPLKKDRMIV